MADKKRKNFGPAERDAMIRVKPFVLEKLVTAMYAIEEEMRQNPFIPPGTKLTLSDTVFHLLSRCGFNRAGEDEKGEGR